MAGMKWESESRRDGLAGFDHLLQLPSDERQLVTQTQGGLAIVQNAEGHGSGEAEGDQAAFRIQSESLCVSNAD
jgi:hypothetical protein